jgi:hypothetical protein
LSAATRPTITRSKPARFDGGGGADGSTRLTDGTYFLNRWFAELIPKTVVPIGYVGVVVSYYGLSGQILVRLPPRRRVAGEARRSARPLGPENTRSTRTR